MPSPSTAGPGNVSIGGRAGDRGGTGGDGGGRRDEGRVVGAELAWLGRGRAREVGIFDGVDADRRACAGGSVGETGPRRNVLASPGGRVGTLELGARCGREYWPTKRSDTPVAISAGDSSR